MKTMHRRINWPVAFVLAVLAGLVAYTTQAQKAPPPLSPAVVATVNIEEIFRGLNERAAADTSLLELAEELDAKGVQMREEIELLGQDLELYPVGSKQYQQATEEIARKTYRLQAYREFAMRKLEVEKSRTLHGLYLKIRTAVGEMSGPSGYDIVFVDDTVVGLPTDVTEAEMWRQISARRMLFTNPRIDVTDHLLEYMNNAFKVAQGN